VEIWIYNQYTDQREVVKVDDDQIAIGRDESNTIALRSQFVSRKHARIIKDSGSFFVESLGSNGVVVANKVVPPKERKKIEYGDEIRIGEFSIYMMEPATRRVAGQQRAITPRKQVIELEQVMHAELLERLNLRVTGQAGAADSQHVALIKRHLADIIQSHMAQVDAGMADHLIHEFMLRSVTTELARRSTGKLVYSYGFEDTDLLLAKNEEAIGRIIGDILGDLPLRFRPGSLKDDMATIESAWPAQMQKMASRLGGELRDYLVRRMLSKEIEDVVLGYGPLQDLLEMPNVNEIMVVGKDRIFIEKDGRLQNTGRSFFSDDVVQSVIERIITPVGRRIDRSTPLVDARLSDGSRVRLACQARF
jgi:pilus assembly protein CpaF